MRLLPRATISPFHLACFIGAAIGLALPAPARSATASVIYNFKPADGPGSGALTRLGASLYGVTPEGGSDNGGTVYAINQNDQYKLIYSFVGAGSSGPLGRLLAYKGALYGTTIQTVFKVTPTGSFNTLFTFQSAKDGKRIAAGISELGGVFYGTTLQGGGGGGGCKLGCGTVFSVTPAGAFTKIYKFMGGVDGDQPSELVAGAGKVFGTTPEGGAGSGTLFSVTPTGVKTVLHNFEGGANGGYPSGRLYYRNGALYGAASGGDITGVCGSSGCGLIYKLTLSGTYTVLHTFENTDGASPTGGLIDSNGFLYGTTQSGGPGGNGVIYGIDPSGGFALVYGFGNEGPLDLNEGLAVRAGSFYGTSLHNLSHSEACDIDPCGTLFEVTP